MSGYDRTLQLAREGNGFALALLNACYQWVLKQGPDHDFAARWVLGGIPAVNLRTLSAGGILEKVGSARGGDRAYYRMTDPDGVGRALRTLGVV
jgi:hypothetical protein